MIILLVITFGTICVVGFLIAFNLITRFPFRFRLIATITITTILSSGWLASWMFAAAYQVSGDYSSFLRLLPPNDWRFFTILCIPSMLLGGLAGFMLTAGIRFMRLESGRPGYAPVWFIFGIALIVVSNFLLLAVAHISFWLSIIWITG
jgi:hypothetical protein